MIDEKSGLYYESTGSENAQTIVFLHGGGVSGWMWHTHVAMLSPHYHCLVPDLPEQGNSAEVGPFSVEFAADCVADMIRNHTQGAKAHVVGLSEGAQVLVALLSRHPEVIDHAVCSSAILRPLPSGWIYARGVFRWAYRWFVAPLKNNDWWIRLNMHQSAGIGDEFFKDFKDSFQGTKESGFVNLMYHAMHFRMPGGLEKADSPVLVVVGKREYKQMKESALDLLEALSHAKGAMVSLGKGSSLVKEHNWALTAPGLFVETTKAWIEDRALPQELLRLSRTD